MPNYISSENQRLIAFKATWPDFTAAARADGLFRGHYYPFCLPPECAVENLYAGIRADALDYFERHAIKWHMGQNRQPSNHLRSSQVCCVNFLEPFATRPAALAALLRPLYGDVVMLPIEDDRFVAYEWIGAKNYMREHVSRNGQRTRGALFTSADAAVRFKREDGRCQVVLIEWKYTETYGKRCIAKSKGGTDRREIYRHLWEREDCPLDRQRLTDFRALFYDPFDQLMRQQFLAHEMERAGELGADVVSTLHIAPGVNVMLERVTSPRLRPLGETVSAVWATLVRPADRFASISTEALFGRYQPKPEWGLTAWQAYLRARYGSLLSWTCR